MDDPKATHHTLKIAFPLFALVPIQRVDWSYTTVPLSNYRASLAHFARLCVYQVYPRAISLQTFEFAFLLRLRLVGSGSRGKAGSDTRDRTQQWKWCT
jgi:hypothetical protein